MIDGQVALARAAREQGAWRIVPSDYGLNLFAATLGEHPAFDMRREADEAIAGLGIEHLHVLNGAFLDGTVDMGFDHTARTVSYWGTGDEAFEATTVDDTARFTARAAVDRDLISGLFPIIGDRVSPNGMTDIVERISGEHSCGEATAASTTSGACSTMPAVAVTSRHKPAWPTCCT